MGFFVTRVGLHHFIVSLAVMVIVRGLCLLVTGRPAARPVHPAAGVQVHRPGLDRPDPGSHRHLRRRGRRLRLPVAPARPMFRKVFYTGSNEKAAAYSGIRTKQVMFLTTVLCSTLVRRRRHHLHGALRLGAADLRRRHGAQRHRRGGDRRRQPLWRLGHHLRRDPRHASCCRWCRARSPCSTSRSTGRISSAARSC